MVYSKKEIGVFAGAVIIAVIIGFFIGCVTHQLPEGLKEGPMQDGVSTVEEAGANFTLAMSSQIDVNENGLADIRFDNGQSGNGSCIVKLYVDAEGENAEDALMYESSVIPQGYYIENVALTGELTSGEHTGYALVETLSDDGNTVENVFKINLNYIVS